MKPFQILILLLVLGLLLCACGQEPAAEVPRTTNTAASDASASAGTTVPHTEPAQTLPPIPSAPPEGRPEPVLPEPEEIRPAKNYAAALAQLTEGLRTEEPLLSEGEPGEVPGGDMGAEETVWAPDAAGGTRLARILAEGKSIYLLDSRNLTVLRAEGKKSRILCTVPVEREEESLVRGLFAAKGRLAVLYTCSGFDVDETGGWVDRSSTHLVIYDTSEPSKPRLVAESALEGSLLDAFLLDGSVCLVTNCYRPAPDPAADPAALIPTVTAGGKTEPVPPESLYLCPNPNHAAFTLVARFSLKTGSLRGSLAFTDASAAAYTDGESLYLTRTLWQDGVSEPYSQEGYSVTDRLSLAHTELRRIRCGKGPVLTGSARVAGILAGTGGLDLRDGRVRLVTCSQPLSAGIYYDAQGNPVGVRRDETENSSRLTVLDEDLAPLSVLEHLAGDRQLCGCRFLDKLCCLLPADPEAPAVAVSLADPAAPEELKDLSGEASAAGLSAFGEDLLLSMNCGAGETLRMTDLSDPENPRTLDAWTLPKDSGETLRAGSAVYLDPEGGFICFPADREAASDYGYRFCRWNGEKFEDLGELRLAYLPEDACPLRIGKLLYLCSPGVVYVTDPETAALLATVSEAEG